MNEDASGATTSESELLKDRESDDCESADNGNQYNALGSFEQLLDCFKPSAHLRGIEAALILLSFSYGSAIIVLPNILLRLGSITWLLYVVTIVVISGYCAYLNNQSMALLLDARTSPDVLRDPYLAIAELASGPIFRKIVATVMYIAMLTNSLSYILLSASLINDAQPFDKFSYYNSIRVWICIVCLTVAPFMYFGNFRDLKCAATLAVIASSIALLGIVTNSIIAKVRYNIQADYTHKVSGTTLISDYFISFGLITFAVAGPSFAIPNIVVHVSERAKFPRTIGYTFLTILAIYLLAGSIPYIIFGNKTNEMVTKTFAHFTEFGVTISVFKVITDICLSLHLLLEAVLVVNPLYQHFEELLNIPDNVSLKRIAVRTIAVLAMCFTCLCVPQFRAVLSIVGGVPLALVGIIFPLYIHLELFESTLFTKCFHFALAILFTVFIFGNLVFTINKIVQFTINHDPTI